MRTTRTNRHLIYGVSWLFGCSLIFMIIGPVMAPESKEAVSLGAHLVYSQIGSFISVVGFASIFFSWARVDAAEHGRPKSVAVAFSVLWLFFNVLAHFVYLFITRGWREGALSSLRFICYLLFAGIVWFGIVKFFGTLISVALW